VFSIVLFVCFLPGDFGFVVWLGCLLVFWLFSCFAWLVSGVDVCVVVRWCRLMFDLLWFIVLVFCF